jgi:hypothetical protein
MQSKLALFFAISHSKSILLIVWKIFQILYMFFQIQYKSMLEPCSYAPSIIDEL